MGIELFDRALGAKAPWNDGDPMKERNRRLNRTPQEEIDICLNCTSVSCDHGNCSAVRSVERQQRAVVTPPPPDFVSLSLDPANTIPVLAERYGVSQRMVSIWRRDSGLAQIREREIDVAAFERDARAGIRMRELMAIYHIGSRRAHRLYEELGIPIPPKGRSIKEATPRVRNLEAASTRREAEAPAEGHQSV